jgi:hypothetical protein
MLPTVRDHTRHVHRLILLSKEINLLSGVQYEWSAHQNGIDFVLEVTMDGTKVDSVRTDASTVKGFGFFSTVRYPGSKADLIIDIKPPAKNAK